MFCNFEVAKQNDVSIVFLYIYKQLNFNISIYIPMRLNNLEQWMVLKSQKYLIIWLPSCTYTFLQETIKCSSYTKNRKQSEYTRIISFLSSSFIIIYFYWTLFVKFFLYHTKDANLVESPTDCEFIFWLAWKKLNSMELDWRRKSISSLSLNLFEVSYHIFM